MCTACDINRPEAYLHRWEIPLARLGLLVTIGAVLVAILAVAMLDEKALDDNNWLLSGLFVLLGIPVIFFSRFFLAADHRANAAKAGPEQFPEIWSIYSELLDRFELQNPPALYVQNGNGVVNAFAFSCSRARNYVIMYSEIAMLAKDQPDVVRFVLAHELAHHKLGHVTLWRLGISVILNMMYLPGKALSRAQEYSADRLALAMCPGTADSLMMLSVGPWLSGHVSASTFEQQADEEKKSLMVRIVNATRSHPVFTKRFSALKQIEKDGFRHHGPLF